MTPDEYLAAAIKANRDMPNGSFREGWAAGPVGMHRDSDAYARSNYRVGLAEMIEAAGIDPEEIDHMPRTGPEPDNDSPLYIGAFGHWAVGWIEEILYRADHSGLVAAAYGISQRLEDYPLLDEEDATREEWEENHPEDGSCYSDDPDCCS